MFISIMSFLSYIYIRSVYFCKRKFLIENLFFCFLNRFVNFPFNIFWRLFVYKYLIAQYIYKFDWDHSISPFFKIRFDFSFDLGKKRAKSSAKKLWNLFIFKLFIRLVANLNFKLKSALPPNKNCNVNNISK